MRIERHYEVRGCTCSWTHHRTSTPIPVHPAARKKGANKNGTTERNDHPRALQASTTRTVPQPTGSGLDGCDRYLGAGATQSAQVARVSLRTH